MKKVALLSIVLILLVVAVVPVMAGNGNGNGRGNGTGQGNTMRDQDRDRTQDQDKHSNRGLGKFKNQETSKWKSTPFYVQGILKAVGADTITVTVIHANAKAKQFIGKDFVIKVNEATLIYQVNRGEGQEGNTAEGSEGTNDEGSETGRTPLKLGDLAPLVNQKVAVHGRFVDPDYVARLVTVFVGMEVGEAVSIKP